MVHVKYYSHQGVGLTNFFTNDIKSGNGKSSNSFVTKERETEA